MEETTDNALKPIILKTPLGFDYFAYNEIIMFKAEHNNTLVFTTVKDTPVRALCNLNFIEKNYCNKFFFRCHKSHIINLIHIEKLIIKTRQVQMKKDLMVTISKCCLKKLKEMSAGQKDKSYIQIL